MRPDLLREEIVALLRDGPATVSQLETATGEPVADVQRALANLFALMRVEPVGNGWGLKRVFARTAGRR